MRLKSSLVDPTKDKRTILFMNLTGRPCQTFWLNYEGHEVAYPVPLSRPSIQTRTGIQTRTVSQCVLIHCSVSTVLSQMKNHWQQNDGVPRHQQTYVGHPWIVRDVATKRRLCLRQMQTVPPSDNRVFTPRGAWAPEPNANANQQVAIFSLQHAMPASKHSRRTQRAWSCQVAFASMETNVTDIHIHDPPPVRWSTATHRVYPADFKHSVLALLLCHRHAGEVDTTGSLGLADLPQHLVAEIAERMAPVVWQSADCHHWEGRQDLGAVRVPAAYRDRVTF